MVTEEGPANNLELEILRGLIRDAMKDTVLWLQVNRSADERVYILTMQPKLQELDTIVTHQIKGWTLPGDEKFSQVAGEVLLLMQKAREARGSIVGQNLGRLAERLAPGSRRKSGAENKSRDTAAGPLTHSKFGQNIRRLRKELGWSANRLAEESGIDKKQVISHENKTEPYPKNKEVYADTFTKGFTKKKGVPTTVTVHDLEN